MPLVFLCSGIAIGCFGLGWLLALILTARPADSHLRKHPPGVEEKDPYRLRKNVLLPQERSLYEALCNLAPDGCAVFTKVRLSDLLEITYGAGNRADAYAKVSGRGIDFLICDAGMACLLAISIDEGSPSRDTLAAREATDRILAKAGLPHERFPMRPSYSLDEVRSQVARYLPPRAIEREAVAA
jgi:hypothetical protein